MKKFLPLLLCLLISVFTVARATKPAHTPAFDTKTAEKKLTGQEADAKTLLNDANTDEGVASDNDGASDNEGENMNDDDGDNAAADEDTGDDDGGDENGGDDGGGDDAE